MKMPTAIYIVQVVFLLVCIFKPGVGQLTLTSSEFTCGQSASMVCSRTISSLELISWVRNDVTLLLCAQTICQQPFPPNYNFRADEGIWTLTIDPVELKHNNITIGCQPVNEVPARVSSTIDVTVPIDNLSSLVKTENATDVVLQAVTNCVKPVANINIKWQCVNADQANVIDSDCRLTALPTYTSECKYLNQTCAGPGTYRMGRDVKLPAYRGNYFKLVKIKAVFTDGTTVIEKISGEVKQEVSPRIAPLRDCSVIENTDFSVSCNLSSGDPSTLKCRWTAPSGTMTNNCTLRIPSVQRTSSGTYTCRVENSVGIDTKSFYLDILYKTVISALTIDDREDSLVVNQNKTDVQLKCNVSSNPLSQISLRSTTISGSRILKEELSSDHLLYSLPTATCWDSGIYTCSGRNNVTENKVSKAVILLVQCTARPLHKVEPIITIYRGVGEDVTLNLTVVAYPLPGSELFQWYKLEKEHNINPLNGSTVNLSDTSLESKLSLTNIQDAEFGLYKLTIKYNDILTAYVQIFSIQPKAEAYTRSPNNVAIIGGAVGGGAAVIVIVIIVVVFLRRKAAAKPRRSTDSQRRKANEGDIDDSTTGTQEHNGPNEYYNISSNTCSSSGPYEDLNQCSGTNHEYSTIDRINDDKTTTSHPSLKTYEHLQLTPLR